MHGHDEDEPDPRDARISELELQLSIATDLNVADRTRMEALENDLLNARAATAEHKATIDELGRELLPECSSWSRDDLRLGVHRLKQALRDACEGWEDSEIGHAESAGVTDIPSRTRDIIERFRKLAGGTVDEKG